MFKSLIKPSSHLIMACYVVISVITPYLIVWFPEVFVVWEFYVSDFKKINLSFLNWFGSHITYCYILWVNMFGSYPLIQKQFCNNFIIWAHVFHTRSWFLPLYDYEIQVVYCAILCISTPSHKVEIWYHLLSWSDSKEKNKNKTNWVHEFIFLC